MKYLQSILVIGGLLAACVNIQAQVTIGSDNVPAKAAILDLKTQQPDANNVTSSTGGLLLPRVQLEKLTSLQPFIADTDPNISNFKKQHIGLTVYNVSSVVAENLLEGIYFWNGTNWQTKDRNDISAINGLTMSNNNIELGGTLNAATTLNSSTANPLIVSGKLQYVDGVQSAGMFLMSDANGLASWGSPVLKVYPGNVTMADVALGTGIYRYVNMYVDVPPGKSEVYVGGVVTGTSGFGYVTLGLKGSPSDVNDLVGFTSIPGLAGFPIMNTTSNIGQMVFFVTNTSGATKRLYLMATLGGISVATWANEHYGEVFIFARY